MKRVLSMALASAMLVSLAACGADGGSSGATGESADGDVTLHIMAMRGVGDFPDGTDENHNIFVDYLREQTGYDFEYTFFSQENPEDRNVLVASGQVFDLIGWPSDAAADMVTLYENGYIQPLDDLLELAPNTCAQVPEELWKAVTVDGHIIALPMPCNSGNTGFAIRTDYLENVGKEMPTTLDEFKDVLIAFRDGDPDGNGQNDTIPLGGGVGMPETIRMFRAMFDITATYDVDENGNVFYSLATDAGRAMLETMNEYYTEGLLDPEVPTTNRDLYLERVTSGATACAPMWWWMKKTVDTTLTENLGIADVLDSPLQWIDPIMSDVNGDPIEFDPSTPVQQYLVFPTDGNAEAAMKFVDLCVTDPTAEFLNFGEEGVHWEWSEDGTRTLLPAYDDIVYRWHYCDNMAFNVEHMAESENIEYGPWREPVQTWTGDLDQLSVYYRIAPVSSVNQQYTDLEDYARAEIVKFMTGERPISDFDAFVSELYDKYDLQEICDAFTEAYNAA